MADAREVLEIMKEVAKSRISMLKEGVTFYEKEKRSYYLQQYEEKLKEIERLIRRVSIRLVTDRKDGEETDGPPSDDKE